MSRRKTELASQRLRFECSFKEVSTTKGLLCYVPPRYNFKEHLPPSSNLTSSTELYSSWTIIYNQSRDFQKKTSLSLAKSMISFKYFF